MSLAAGRSRLLTTPFSRIPAAWLRDHCECAKCIDPVSKQKLHTSGSVIGAEAIDASEDTDEIGITWNERDNHKSIFKKGWLFEALPDLQGESEKFLDKYARTVQSTPMVSSFSDQLTWDNLSANKIVYLSKMHDLVKLKNDRACLQEFVMQLKQYGIGFIKHVPADEFVETLQMFGALRETFYGLTWDVKSIANAKNIAYTSRPLPLHMDLM